MKKIKILSLFIICLTSFLNLSINTSAQNSDCLYNITSITILPNTNPPPSQNNLLFTVQVSGIIPPRVPPSPFYIFINYNFRGGVGHSYNNITPTVLINPTATGGTGQGQYALGTIYNGTYTISVAADKYGTQMCTIPDTRFTIAGRQDAPPQSSNCTRNENDDCIPGATDSEICNPDQFWCTTNPIQGGYWVQRRTCDTIGSTCCRNTPAGTPANPIPATIYTCNHGMPSSQTNGCTCIPAPPPEVHNNHPAVCLTGDRDRIEGINTALGCVPFSDIESFTAKIMQFALGLAGGIAIILILIAGFQITTSRGNVEQLKGGRELLNSAIVGLIMIIFSTFLLKLIGIDILGVLR